MFVHLVSIWKNSTGGKVKVWQTAKEGYSYEVEGDKKKNYFYGSYEELCDDLKKRGYNLITKEDTAELFVNNVLTEAAKKAVKKVPTGNKPGAKNPLDVTKVALSPEAKAALKADPKSKEELAKVKDELQKHAKEYAKLNALLNKMRLQKNELLKKKETLSTTLSEKELKYFSIVDKQCSDFLKSVKEAKKFLYRGTRSKLSAFYGKPHEDRKPTDTSVATQAAVDKILSTAGFKAIRSNSIFTSGDKYQADNYGTPYLIFPKNGFSFTWSTKHSDWVPTSAILKKYINGSVSASSDIESEVRENLKTIKVFAKAIEMIREKITEFIDGVPYDGYTPNQLTKLKQEMFSDGASLTIDQFNKRLEDIERDKLFDNLDQFRDDDVESIDEDLRDLDDSWDDDDREERLDSIVDEHNGFVFNSKKIISNWKQLIKKYKINDEAQKASDKKKLEGFNNLLDEIVGLEIIKNNSSALPTEVTTTKVKAKEFVTKHAFKNVDMTAALKSENEIYINGEYIALKASEFEKAAYKYFLNKVVTDDDDDDY